MQSEIQGPGERELNVDSKDTALFRRDVYAKCHSDVGADGAMKFKDCLEQQFRNAQQTEKKLNTALQREAIKK